MQGLQDCSLPDRLAFFSEGMRLRKRERHIWLDTPLAKVFIKREDWKSLKARVKIQQVSLAIKRKKKLNARAVFIRYDVDNDGCLSYDEMQRALVAMKLGFSPHDVADIVRLADPNNTGRISLDEFTQTFNVDIIDADEEKRKREEEEKAKDAADNIPEPTTWTCTNCTFLNSIYETTCAMCEMGWAGRREVPRGKWMCSPDEGGCSYFNNDSQFYCDICNRARNDLRAIRF